MTKLGQILKQPHKQWVYLVNEEKAYFCSYDKCAEHPLPNSVFTLLFDFSSVRQKWNLDNDYSTISQPPQIIMNDEICEKFDFWFGEDISDGLKSSDNQWEEDISEYIKSHNRETIKFILDKPSVIEALADGASYSREFALFSWEPNYLTTYDTIAKPTTKTVSLAQRPFVKKITGGDGGQIYSESGMYHSQYAKVIDTWIENAPGGSEILITGRTQMPFDSGDKEFYSEEYFGAYLGYEQ